MIFVVVYDRENGKVLQMERFADDQDLLAQALRQRCESEHAARSEEVEVVILEAASEEALKRTHGRYFGGVRVTASEVSTRARRVL